MEDPRQPRPIGEPAGPGLWQGWPRRNVLALIVLLVASNFMVQILVYVAGGGLFWPVLAGAVAGVLVPLFLIGRGRGLRADRDLGLDLPDARTLGAATIMALCSLVPTSLLAELSVRLHPPDPQWESFMLENLPRTTPGIVLAAFTVVIAAPLVEEIIFRGLLQRLATNAWGAGAGAAISALVFAIVHNEAWFIFGLIGIGLVLAFVYHATKSVTASWVTHGVHNAVSLALMLSAGDSLAGPSELTLQDAGWALLSLLGLILAGGYLLARSGRRLT